MTLIVEDGNIIPGANTYVSLADVRSFAELRGRVLSDDDDVVTAYIYRAMDYLQSYDQQYKGTPIDATIQPLSFPRTGVKIGSYTVPDDVIPTLLKTAEIQLVIDINNGLELQPSFPRSDPLVKRKRIGPLETEWFEGEKLSPQLTAFWALINPLLSTDALDIRRTLRI